jgi:HSP20 family protein
MIPGSLMNRQDRPFGRLFGTLWRDIEDEFADMERRMDQLWRDAAGCHVRPPLVWGYTMQVGPDGRTRFQPFGNVSQSNEALAEGWRQPFTTTVLDEENNVVRITAELPGIKKDAVQVETLPNEVRITAEGEPWKYRAHVPIAHELNPDGADASYNNGILELTVPLAKPVQPQGKKIKVR